jgi:ferredoxin--NADP+ reductase
MFDLNGGRAVVVGNGNVAIEVARMLVLDPGELAPTDTADHALDAFGMAGVTEVVLLGRRGPGEAAFTNPELRELGELGRADVIVDPGQLEGVAEPEEPTKRRNVEILREYAHRAPAGKSHRLELRFMRSPLEILGDGEDGPVTGVRVTVTVNELVAGEDGRVSVRPTGEEEVIECGLVLRSIGYRGVALAGIPFEERRGLIRNDAGRVVSDDGVCRGEYVVGWIKRGPSGVIGTNKKDAADTVAKILQDVDAGALGAPDPELAEADSVLAWISDRAPGLVTWEGWEAIDAHESALGAPAGRPRVKLVRLAELIEAGRAARS